MVQTTVEEFMVKGIPGQLADLSNKQVRTFINNQKQQFTASVTAINLLTTITVNGVAITANAGAGAATQEVIRDELLVNLAAAGLPVIGSAVSTDQLAIRSNTPDVAITVVGTTNASVVENVTNGASIGFGLYVIRDASPGADTERDARLPNAAADITAAATALGIVLHSHANEQNIVNADNKGYISRSAMSTMIQGYAYVTVEDTVVAGQPAFVRYAAGAGGTQLGAFRSDDPGSEAATNTGLRFESSALAGGIAIVRISGETGF